MKEVIKLLEQIKEYQMDYIELARSTKPYLLADKAIKLIEETQLNNLLKPDVSGRSEQLVFECKVCGKPYGDKLSLYEHYDKEHNKN